jgi:hypothetical protein
LSLSGHGAGMLQTAIAAILFASSLGSAIAAAVCLFLAERSPRSEIARRLIEHEREMEDPRHYAPATELLSERGQLLRRRGRRLSVFAGIAMLALFVLATRAAR